MSSQLSVVSVALFIELLKLHNVEFCFCKPLGVVFHPLPDSGGEPKGCGMDGGIEHRVESEDCLY